MEDNNKNDNNTWDAQAAQVFVDVHRSCKNFAREFGIGITEIRDGYARTELKVKPDHLNPNSAIHGGVLFTLADTANGVAVYAGCLSRCSTVDSSFSFLRPGLGKSLIYAEAEIVKKGRNIVVTEVSVRDQDGLELARGLFTNMLLNMSKIKQPGEQGEQ